MFVPDKTKDLYAMKFTTLFILAVSLFTTNVIAQTGPEQLTITVSGGLLQQRPAPVIIEFSATGNDAFNTNDTTSETASNALLTALPDSNNVNLSPDSSSLVLVFDSINNIYYYKDTTTLATTTSGGNWGSNILPYVVSSDDVIIDKFDSRPVLDQNKVYNFGIASDHNDTITISASAFLDTLMNSSNNKQITFVYLEDLTTGLFYSLLDQNVMLAIPTDTVLALNYKLHVMVRSAINAIPATCLDPASGSVFIQNTNCTNWNYTIYHNGTVITSGSVVSQDTTVTNLPVNNYTVTVYTNNVLTDSVQITVQGPVQIVPYFTADDYSVYVYDVVSFTNSSAGAALYNWSFGDSETDSLENPTHTFGAAGNYPVTLTAINSYGCQSTFTDTIVVLNSPYMQHGPNVTQSLDENISVSNIRHANEATVFANGKNITVALNAEAQNVNVEIMNMNGQLISSNSVMDASTVFQVAEAGIYIVRIAYANGEVVSKKILVNN
jgi:PKD repeat protein